MSAAAALPFSGSFGGIVADPLWQTALISALVIAAIGATWRARAPGGITTGERRAHTRRGRSALALFGWMMWIAPWIVAAAAVQFVHPWQPKRIVVLISRSRLDTQAAKGRWAEKLLVLKAHLKMAKEDDLVDAGAVVKEVLLRLVAPAGGFAPGDPQTEQAVAKALRRVLVEDDVPPPPITAAELIPPLIPPNTPRWVVESVEISVLRALTRRYDVPRIYALVAERHGPVGPVWTGVQSFLQSTEDGKPNKLEADVQTVPEQEAVTLENITRVGFDQCEHGVRVEFSALVDARSRSNLPLTLSLFDGNVEVAPRQELSFPASDDAQIVRKAICFAFLPDKKPPDFSLLEMRTGPPVQSLRLASRTSRSHSYRVGELHLQVLAPAKDIEAWTSAKEVIAEQDGNAIQFWRNRMETLGYNLRGASGGSPISIGVDECKRRSSQGGNGVVLNACGDGIWVYPASLLDTALPGVQALESLDNHSIVRPHSTWRGLPGSDSWNGVTLLRGRFWRPVGTPFEALMEGKVFSSELASGTSRTRAALPLVTRAVAGDEKHAIVTYLGFDPREQALFPAAPAFDAERFLAAWTQIIEAAYTADAGPPAEWSVAESDTQPYCFLDGRDLARVSGRVLWTPFAFLALGTLLHIGTIALGVLRRPLSAHHH